jgi:predicted dehydrogenase
MDGKVRAAVIGVGIGYLHLQGYAKSPHAEVVAVCDIDKGRAERVASEFGVPHVFTDYKEMLKMDEIDMVSVCVPNYLHAPVTIDCFEAGKHVVCEKPMAMNAAEGAAMVEAAKKANRKLMMAFNNRFRGDTQVLKRFIEAGELGEIYFAKTGWIRRQGIPGMGGWFTTKSMSGGGPLIDIGVHMLDVTMYLMGNPKPVSVVGVTYAKFGPRGLGQGGWGTPVEGGTFDVEDMAAALIRFANGSTVFLEASWASYIQHDMMYSSLLGTEGGADLEPLRIYKQLQGTQADITPQFPRVSGHEQEILHFVECVKNDTEPISTGEHGLDVMKILDGIYKSAETGEQVAIE